MNKEDILKKIENAERELKEAKEQLNNYKEEKWQDKLIQPSEHFYYYILSDYSSGYIINNNNGNTAYNRKPEHAFKTKEQAELIKDKILLMQEMYAFAHVRNEGYIPDWNDYSVYKYGINYSFSLKIVECNQVNLFVFGIAVKTKEIAEEMLNVFGDRIDKIYNNQY